MKSNKSWSKADGVANLIGIKKVDWSIIEDGSTIPCDFHEDFDIANGNHLNRGERNIVHLIYEGVSYEAHIS